MSRDGKPSSYDSVELFSASVDSLLTSRGFAVVDDVVLVGGVRSLLATDVRAAALYLAGFYVDVESLDARRQALSDLRSSIGWFLTAVYDGGSAQRG